MSVLDLREIEAFRRGDELVFRRIVHTCSPRLLSLARAFARDDDEAHDLLQEGWRRVYEKRATYGGEGSFEGWLYSVCRSVFVTIGRKRKGREALGTPGELTRASAPPSPDAATEAEELRRSIQVALFQLPEREREVVVLRLMEGMSVREAAEAMGCAEGTVKATLHHALKKLQSKMEVWVR